MNISVEPIIDCLRHVKPKKVFVSHDNSYVIEYNGIKIVIYHGSDKHAIFSIVIINEKFKDRVNLYSSDITDDDAKTICILTDELLKEFDDEVANLKSTTIKNWFSDITASKTSINK